MNIFLDDNGWGEGKTEDICSVLKSVVQAFGPCFGESINTKDLYVLHVDDPQSPPHCKQNYIYLNTENRFWSQYAYQFAHEYCHCQIDGNVSQHLRWFEESLCELASYFVLPRVSDLWKTNPPYPSWKEYADNFRIYAELDQQKATPFDLNFSGESDTLVHLVRDEYDREKNAYVALNLMPVFKANFRLWSVVPIIKDIPQNLSFAESLRYWKKLSPDMFKRDIDTIAEVFSIVL